MRKAIWMWGLIVAVWLTQIMLVSADLGILPRQNADEETRSWFVYTLNLGESREDVVVVNNHSEEAMTVVVEALDAVSTSDGGYSLVSSIDDNRDLGNWVELDKTELVIPALSSAEVGFKLTVPQTASVGEHNGGVVVYAKESASAGNLKIQTRVAARIYVTVPGVVERNITFQGATFEMKDGKSIFTIRAKNESNIKLEPALDISVKGLFVAGMQSEDAAGTFLAGSDMVIEREWIKGKPRFGYYFATVALHTWSVKQTLADGSVSNLPNETFTYRFGFWVGSVVWFWILLILILAWLVFRIWVYRNDRNKYLTKFTTHTAKANDTVVRLAEEHRTKPKYIIQLNSLLWPYAINAQDKLLIPKGRLTAEELSAKRAKSPLPSILIYLFSGRLSLYHPEKA